MQTRNMEVSCRSNALFVLMIYLMEWLANSPAKKCFFSLLTRMHSSRIRTTCFSGRLSCHTRPLPCTPPCHAHPLPGTSPCHARSLATHAPLWTEGMTHACENITLPQTSLADGKNNIFFVTESRTKN